MAFFETLLTVATEKVGETLLTGVSARLNPSDVETSLKQAIKTANQEFHPNGLFDRFPEDGRLVGGYGPFLNQFFQGAARSELQKPLEDNQGRPDITFLARALAKQAEEHSKLRDLETECGRHGLTQPTQG